MAMLLGCFVLLSTACWETDSGLGVVDVFNVTVPAEQVRGDISVRYVLRADPAQLVQIAVEYCLSDDTCLEATPAVSGGAGFGMAAEPSGSRHEFVWDSFADLGNQEQSLTVRVRAANNHLETQGISVSFVVVNNNLTPSIEGKIPENKSLPASVAFSVSDPEDDPVSVRGEYSLDSGSTWKDASLVGTLDALDSSENAGSTEVFWNAAEDLGTAGFDNLRLKLIPSDTLGDGTPWISDSFSLPNEATPTLVLVSPSSAVRYDVPLQFTLFGNADERYSVFFRYSMDGSEYFDASQQASAVDGATRLRADARGVEHLFTWDSVADLGQSTARGLVVEASLADAYGKLLEDISVRRTDAFDVVNSPVSVGPLISEICLHDADGPGFVEIYGQPGYLLDGIRLLEFDRRGVDYIPMNRGYVDLDGIEIPESGLVVVTAPGGYDAADLIEGRFASFFEIPPPESLVLTRPAVDNSYDRVGMGNFADAGYVFAGEGSPAPYPGDGLCLHRVFSNTDSDDNSVDFVLAPPSPGEGFVW